MSITEAPPTPPAIPLLEAGDHLTRDEFERRYHAMPHGKKAELLKGTVFMPSPVRAWRHARPHVVFSAWLFGYEMATPGVIAADNATIRLGGDEPQPDLLMQIADDRGGQSWVDADDYIEGPPELVVEIAASSVSYDLGVKLEVYREQGVREYLAWRVLDRAVDWFALRGDKYELLPVDPDGLMRSEVFPGLWLDVEALLTRDGRRLLAALHQGTASAEHARFVQQLSEGKS